MTALRNLSIAVALLLAPTPASSQAVSFEPHDVRSVFYVAKSENQNQVHYGLRLDAQCRPVGKQPVFAYWRRLKRGARVDEPLLGAGTRVYGPSDEQKVDRGASSGRVQLYVKALDRLKIEVRAEQGPDGCRATPYTTLRGVRARLSHAFLQLGSWGLRVKYVDVVGFRASDAMRLVERFE